MFLWSIRQAEYGIFALGDESECPTLDFLKQLGVEDPREFAKVQARLDQTSHNGPPHNESQCNALGNGCFELKTKKVRLACFWDAGRLILCSHAFVKRGQKTPKLELERLYANKERYFKEKQRENERKR